MRVGVAGRVGGKPIACVPWVTVGDGTGGIGVDVTVLGAVDVAVAEGAGAVAVAVAEGAGAVAVAVAEGAGAVTVLVSVAVLGGVGVAVRGTGTVGVAVSGASAVFAGSADFFGTTVGRTITFTAVGVALAGAVGVLLGTIVGVAVALGGAVIVGSGVIVAVGVDGARLRPATLKG